MIKTILSPQLLCSASLLATLGLSGCATESYVDEKVAALQQQIHQVNNDTQTALKLANGKFNYTETQALTVNFDTNKYAISADDQAKLDELAGRLKQEDKNVFVIVEGYADTRGAHRSNERLGLLRANAVASYLRDKGVGMNRMSIVSHGEDNPAGPGHEENRRVVVSLAE
jgi:outer membrane protein OmpA-like peptidoglycan-associated protein